MKCKIAIKSCGNGWNDNTQVFGEYSYEGGVGELDYFLNGDKCKLTISKTRLEQVRTGSVDIKITLQQNQKTLCIIGGEEMRGGYEVVTQSFKALVGKMGCMAEITYLSGKDKEKINFSLAVLAI
jgi:hypothetical protein